MRLQRFSVASAPHLCAGRGACRLPGRRRCRGRNGRRRDAAIAVAGVVRIAGSSGAGFASACRSHLLPSQLGRSSPGTPRRSRRRLRSLDVAFHPSPSLLLPAAAGCRSTVTVKGNANQRKCGQQALTASQPYADEVPRSSSVPQRCSDVPRGATQRGSGLAFAESLLLGIGAEGRVDHQRHPGSLYRGAIRSNARNIGAHRLPLPSVVWPHSLGELNRKLAVLRRSGRYACLLASVPATAFRSGAYRLARPNRTLGLAEVSESLPPEPSSGTE